MALHFEEISEKFADSISGAVAMKTSLEMVPQEKLFRESPIGGTRNATTKLSGVVVAPANLSSAKP